MQRFAVFLFGLLVLSASVQPISAYSFAERSGLNRTAEQSGYATGAAEESKTLSERVGEAIGVVISFVGVLFLGLTIYGGFKWMMARGNDSEVAAAKKMIEQAVIGLIIVLMAYAITQFIAYEAGGEAFVAE